MDNQSSYAGWFETDQQPSSPLMFEMSPLPELSKTDEPSPASNPRSGRGYFLEFDGMSKRHVVKSQDQILEVYADEEKILLPGDEKLGIGIRELNGCTAIVVFDKAIAIAHSSPVPGEWERVNDSEKELKDLIWDHYYSLFGRIVGLTDDIARQFSRLKPRYCMFYIALDNSISPSTAKKVKTMLHASNKIAGNPGYQLDVQFSYPPYLWTPAKGQILAWFDEEKVEVRVEGMMVWENPTKETKKNKGVDENPMNDKDTDEEEEERGRRVRQEWKDNLEKKGKESVLAIRMRENKKRA